MTRLLTRTARIRVLVVALAILTPLPAAHAAGVYRTVEGDGLRVVIDGDWVTQAAPGYIPIRFDITNSSGARTIEIIERGGRFQVGSSPSYGRATQGRLTVMQRLTLARALSLNS